MLVGAIGLFQYRLKIMDFLHGYLDGTIVLVIPKPKPLTENIYAIIKPFQPWVNILHLNNLVYMFFNYSRIKYFQVWFSLFCVIVATFVSLKLINRYLKWFATASGVISVAGYGQMNFILDFIIKVLIYQCSFFYIFQFWNAPIF